MPLFGLRNLIKSAVSKAVLPEADSESLDEDESCDGPFETPFGNSLPRRRDLEDEVAWQDKEPLRSGPPVYSRLEADEIRLVYIYPGEPSDCINLSTEICKIDDAEEDYAALSYVWGDSGDTSPIYVNRHEYQATANLVAALRHIRGMLREDELCVLWIDAISINQTDIEERNNQVSMMRQIYEQPLVIIIWLGENDGAGLRYLKELGEWYYDREENPLSQQRKQEHVDGVKHVKGRYQELRAAASVISNTYWQRVWTVQEYSAPQAGFFLSGDVWMDRAMMSGALIMYVQALRILQRVAERQGQNGSFVDGTVIAVERLRHGDLISYLRSSDKHKQTKKMEKFTFLDMLLKFRDLKSTDPRDKIYAPLKLSPDMMSLVDVFKVDYNLTIRELFIQVACHFLKNEHWPLCVLELCKFGAADDLPSWVPDWRTLPRYLLSRDGGTGSQILNAGKGMFTPGPSTSPAVLPGDYLQLTGIQMGCLLQVWQPWYSQDMRDTTEISITIDDPLSTYPESPMSLAEAMRTIISPKNPLDQPVESTDLVLLTRHQWRRDRNLVARLNRRRLARVSHGFVGLVSAEAQADDELWLFRGGNVFHVLRPSASGRRVLIGEAILQGLMNGELEGFKELSKDFPPPETVELE